MWFIIPVREYHQLGPEGNERAFRDLAARSPLPLGLVAYAGDALLGWVAAGPRSRYARAVRTPTLKTVDASENDAVWLAPCFFIRPERRGEGIARALLAGAIALADASGAPAIEGFPFAGAKRRSTDQQVGSEALFASCGFRPVSQPSPNRVIMRRDFSGR